MKRSKLKPGGRDNATSVKMDAGPVKKPFCFLSDEEKKLISENMTCGALPARVIDLTQVIYWLELGATTQEIAGSFHVGVSTLERKVKEHFNCTVAELRELCGGTAKLYLRHKQFESISTSVDMQKFLGKEWLGQNSKGDDSDKLKNLGHMDAITGIRVVDDNSNVISETAIEPKGIECEV